MKCSRAVQIPILLYLTSQVKLDIADYKNVDDLLEMVVSNISASFKYSIPEDNSNLLNVENTQVNSYGNFDFIIVGGGAAGSVLANRLSEVKDWNILLLEAGETENDFINIPGMNSFLPKSDLNWGYNIKPQSTPYGIKKKTYIRGKALGGSTVLNGAVYARGNPEDYNNWKLPGWSYDEILPYFMKSENVNFVGYEQNYHGKGGYWNVIHQPDLPGLQPLIVNGFKELGQEEIQDYNGRSQLGISRAQYNYINGERLSSARAFLNPSVKTRNNLNITLNAFVTKLQWSKDNKFINGVEFVKSGKKFVATSKKETLLSAGSVNSPQILMLSGIGPKTDLQKLGIKSIRDLPVGKSAVDHIFYSGVYFKSNHTFFNLTFNEQADLYLNKKMPWRGTTTYFNFLKLNSTQNQSRPDIELIVTVSAPSYQDYPNDNKLQAYSSSFDHMNDIIVRIVLMKPRSRGSVSLQSNRPKDFPIIDPNFYSDPEKKDLEIMYQAMLYLEKLNQTKAFKENGMNVYYPEIPECDPLHTRHTEVWYKCILLSNPDPGLHLVSTTPMGISKENSVVDPCLRVHGIKKLRIVDAGVMPHVNSGHTAAPTIAIAEKAADIIKRQYSAKGTQDKRFLWEFSVAKPQKKPNHECI